MENDLREDISFIKRILEENRYNLEERGFYYTFWGVIVLIGTGIAYALTAANLHGAIGPAWMIICLAGAGFTVFRERGRVGQQKVKTFAGRMQAGLWSGFLISILVFVGLLFIAGAVRTGLLIAVISILLGMTYWINGLLVGLRWIQLLAFVWWAGAFAVMAVPETYAPAAMALLVAGLNIVPGIILQKRYQKEKSN
jgi:hypothetical protein